MPIKINMLKNITKYLEIKYSFPILRIGAGIILDIRGIIFLTELLFFVTILLV